MFTAMTGDRNPLHYDAALAAAAPFGGGLIVQGGVTSGLLNAVVAEDLPGPGSVFLGVEWRFVKAVAVGVIVLTSPGLGELRRTIVNADPVWLAAAVGLEVLSVLSYVVIFRAVFCTRMGWRLTYQIGMSEQAANSVLSVSGTGGLALGAWALHRGGMDTKEIGRKSVTFFFLTSLPNVFGVIVFAALYAIGVLSTNPSPAIVYGFGAGALAASPLAPRTTWRAWRSTAPPGARS